MRTSVTTIGASSPSKVKASSKSIRNLSAMIITALGVILTSYFGYRLVTKSSLGQSGALLEVQTLDPGADVYLNSAQLGQTPIEAMKVKKGAGKVRLSKNGLSYETNVELTEQFATVIKHDLGVDQFFSSGQNLWFEKASSENVLSIISEPSEAKISIDGVEVGKTPFSTDKLTEGGFEVNIEKDGYEAQSAYVEIKKTYTLNLSAKLFPLPAPQSIKLMTGSENIYDVVTSEDLVYSNPQNWAKALVYFNKTRGLNLMGLGINREVVFDALVDFNGKIYDKEGVETATASLSESSKLGYLRRGTDPEGLSEAAKKTISDLGKTTPMGKTAKVTTTPTGWLRLREEPNLNGKELAKLNVGDEVQILEETTGWTKVKTTAALTGWVSSDYLK
jgi:hypothetical protein